MQDVKPVKAGWYNAFRPWTLHGAIVPVLIGGAVAWKDGSFNILIFLLILAGGCLLQSAANLFNTYGDFVKGTDTVENHTRSPELVTGAMRPKQIYMMGIVCLGITALIGLVFIWYSGWEILIIGLLGIGGAALYTIGVSYKYHAMGQIGCFFLMGILMPIGTYLVLTGGYSWEVLMISLPNALMITAVLSGNETRDYYEDKAAHVGTLSGHMSYENSKRLYLFLNSVSFIILALLIVLQIAPWECALAFVALYDLNILVKNCAKAPADPKCNRLLVPLAFKLNWHFGVLLVIGYLIEYAVVGVLI
ncbi:MAG: 1,4-dihydroxy-2-naphthoate octaprenyltransferase [Candidatus Methanomethylophilaceae archaeon]|jgi:1,4-dihydroxy-2-naphthoate octaprenyltransferase